MAAKTEEKKPLERWALPEMRVINQAFFKKDQYNDKAVPSYKGEFAIRKDDPAVKTLFDKLFNIAADAFPKLDDQSLELKVNGGKVQGVLDGDILAKKRENKGKEGGAYKGHWVIRAHTIYNHAGQDADGGIEVFNEQVERIEAVNSGAIYNGCFGVAAVSAKGWEDTDDDTGEMEYGLTFYLAGFQKTKDGDRLVGSSTTSSLFKPVGRTAGAGSDGGGERRRRAA